MPDDFTTWSPSPGPFPLTEGETGFGAVRSPYAANVVDEAFLGSEGMATDIASQPAYMGLALGAKKLRLAFGAMIVLLLVIVLRAADVQIVKGGDYQRLAEGNRSRMVLVPVERGVMYDRAGAPLVRNIPDFSVSVTPDDLPKEPQARRDAIGRLADILSLTPADIEQKMAEFKDYGGSAVTVADNITHDQAVRVEIENASTPGIVLVTGMRREYLDGAEVPSLSHILGFEGRLTQAELSAQTSAPYQPSDFIGKTGLERSYESVLRGSYGKRRIEVDATGRQKKIISEEPGAPGKNLVLTIDGGLQKDVEKIFKDGLKAAGKKRGSVIVMKPSTGEILAMVSEPAFDNNLFAKGITTEQYKTLTDDPDHPLFPRAVAGALASGSVFKPVVGAAAMTEGVITANTSVLSTGGIRVDKWYFPDWKAGGHGVTNLAKAIAESVNTFFYYVGGGYGDFKGLGIDRIVAYARKFGFGAPLGVDLPSEAAGFLPTKEWKEKTKGETWYIGDTYHVAIGQGDVIVTPLQIAAMTAAFANRGALVRPHVVAAFTSGDGTRTLKDPETIDPQVVPRESIDAVRKGMRQAVTAGSARSLADLPVEVAGKTGTAQWHPTKAPHAWFTSFAPFDKPEIVVTVMIEEGVEGSRTATPVAKAIYQRYFSGARK